MANETIKERWEEVEKSMMSIPAPVRSMFRDAFYAGFMQAITAMVDEVSEMDEVSGEKRLKAYIQELEEFSEQTLARYHGRSKRN